MQNHQSSGPRHSRGRHPGEEADEEWGKQGSPARLLAGPGEPSSSDYREDPEVQ